MLDAPEVTRDALLGGRVTLLQLRGGHRAGTDAVLLAGLAGARPGDRVVDLGAATGAVGLMVARRVPEVTVRFVERDPTLAALCRQNVERNGLGGRAAVIETDCLAGRAERAAAGLAAGEADLVVTNPPFFEEGEGERASPDPDRRSAHTFADGDLARWIGAAADCLSHRGRLVVIHRADRLAHLLGALGRAFGSPAIRPVHPRDGVPASRVVLAAVKGGRAPLRLDPPLVLHAREGGFKPEAASLHGEGV